MPNDDHVAMLGRGRRSVECVAGGTRRGAGFISGRSARARLEWIRSFAGRSSGADLRGVNLSGANLSCTHLEGANLFKTVLDGANFAEAFLAGVQFLSCAQLIATQNWQSAFRDETLACGAGIPDRKPSE